MLTRGGHYKLSTQRRNEGLPEMQRAPQYYSKYSYSQRRIPRAEGL